MGLHAGAAIVDITPKSPCFLAGYRSRDHAHETIHDPISLRALYVRGPSGDGLLISADIIWFMEDFIERILPVLQKELGVPGTNVLFCGTHTHSAPIVRGEHTNPEWLGALEKQVLSAAALAKSRLREAVLTAGRGTCGIGVNRRELAPDGRIILGINPDGPIDREMILVGFDTPDGTPVARVCNFACHGTTLSQRNYQLSGDWSGPAATKIEADLSGGAFLYVNGGAANICPRIDRQESFDPVETLSDEFAADFRTAFGSPEQTPEEDIVGGAELEIHLPRKLRDVEDGQGKLRPIRIRGLRIGSLRIVGFPGEVFSQTTIAVKAESPHPLTMVASYAAGGSGGYVPVAEAYDTGGYEVRVSPYTEGAESILREGFSTLLNLM